MKNVEETLCLCDLEVEKLMSENMATCIGLTQDSIAHKLNAYSEFDSKLVEIPIFIDLYVNTIFSKKKVVRIMEIIGAELSKGTSVDSKYVFIHTHVGNTDYVFIN